MIRRGIRAIVLAGFGLSLAVSLFADEVEIPIPLYIDKFKAECKKGGLDLYDTDESHGFVKNEGGKVIVCTYHTIKLDKLMLIKDAAAKSIRKRV